MLSKMQDCKLLLAILVKSAAESAVDPPVPAVTSYTFRACARRYAAALLAVSVTGSDNPVQVYR